MQRDGSELNREFHFEIRRDVSFTLRGAGGESEPYTLSDWWDILSNHKRSHLTVNNQNLFLYNLIQGDVNITDEKTFSYLKTRTRYR